MLTPLLDVGNISEDGRRELRKEGDRLWWKFWSIPISGLDFGKCTPGAVSSSQLYLWEWLELRALVFLVSCMADRKKLKMCLS